MVAILVDLGEHFKSIKGYNFGPVWPPLQKQVQAKMLALDARPLTFQIMTGKLC